MISTIILNHPSWGKKRQEATPQDIVWPAVGATGVRLRAVAVGGVLAISAVLIRCADPQQLEQAFKETTENIKAQFLPKSP